jgi:aspartate/glutamate racemase
LKPAEGLGLVEYRLLRGFIMRTAGIIGGIGPESTIEYYRLIIASYRKQKPDGSYPSIIINSIGTRFTMQGRFYPDVFTQAGITVVTPTHEEQAYIHDKYLNELVNGIFLPETREGLLAIAERLKAREGIDGLVLGGTELPLILQEVKSMEISFLDTTRLHVEEIVSRLLSSQFVD